MKTQILLFTLFICISSAILGQNTIHVPDDYATIQEGIDAATDGDTVLVSQGIYTENINYYSKAITVTSHYIHTLDSADIYNTVIDGSQPHNPDMASVVRISGPDTTAVICGFTIQNGTGTLITNRGGGGVGCFTGGKIIHNRIINNSILTDVEALGGAIWAEGTTNSHFVIRNNIIEDNHMENINSSNGCWGTGIGFYYGNILVENNIIRHNSATGRPYGNGIYCCYTSGVIRANSITNNTGHHTLANRSRGGGMYLVNNYARLIISNNEITQNQLIHNGLSSEFGGGIGIYNTGGFENERILIEKNKINDNNAMYGGGISVNEMFNIELSNNVIQTNNSENYGGGIYFEYAGVKEGGAEYECHDVSGNKPETSKGEFIPVLVNNTIVGNTAGILGLGGALACAMVSDYLLFNNILYDDSAGNSGNEIYLYGGSNLFLYYNNINTDEIAGSGTWEGEENINVDPCFCFDGYHLMAESGCINTGIESLEINGTEYFAPEYDIDNEPRPFDNYVDMGADEVVITDITEIAGKFKNFRLIGFPNPFLSETTIRYELQKPSAVRLSITSQFGGRAKVLLVDYQIQGKHELQVDLSELAPGVYFCTLNTGEGVQTTKIIKL